MGYEENLDFNKVQYTDTDTAYIVSALMQRRSVDAVVVSEQDTEALLAAGAIILPEWIQKGYDKKIEPRSNVAVNTNFLSSNQRIIEEFIDAYIDAHRLIAEKPKEAAQAVADHIKRVSAGGVVQDPAKIIEQWENKEIENMVWHDPALILRLANQAKEMELVKKDLTISDIYDLHFQSKLEKAQNEISAAKN